MNETEDTKPLHIVAMMYDFDRTLATKDMQEFVFIPALSMTAEEFWGISDNFARDNHMDQILATMYMMVEYAKKGDIDLSQSGMLAQGKKIEFFKGVETWFTRITEYGKKLGLEVRHYIISSGIKTMIEGTSIAKFFTQIFASDFLYDEKGNPIWPSMSINYSSKTQFLYRIHKGVEDTAEHYKLNRRQKEGDMQVPFSNMIYFGDGLTDVPAMKLTRLNGGYAVGVYQDDKNVYLQEDNRVSFFVPADYSNGSLLDKTVKTIIKRISAEMELSTLGWDKI